MQVKTMAEYVNQNQTPEILFWVGCGGSFDQRAQKITKAFVEILNKIGISFAILGKEEMCTGDPARRAGNEFLFQMMAYQNIQTLNTYNIKKIVTTCPHCFNILKNEYPKLNGNYEVIHHSTYLQELIQEGKIKILEENPFNNQKITYHDSCYLGRGNGIYEAPRSIINSITNELVEMKRCKSNGLCCGAGGAQMFKEEETGEKRINTARATDILETKATMVATACPFCATMIQDGLQANQIENKIPVMDIAELIIKSM